MWSNKKPETEQPTTAKPPETPAPVAKPASAKTEGIAMSTDAMRPMSTTPSGSTARLGASLHIKGDLRARDRIEIKKDGSVIGDLTTARIMIEDGAYFKGSIEIDRTAAKNDDVDKPAYSRPATVSSTTTPAHATPTKTSL